MRSGLAIEMRISSKLCGAVGLAKHIHEFVHLPAPGRGLFEFRIKSVRRVI